MLTLQLSGYKHSNSPHKSKHATEYKHFKWVWGGGGLHIYCMVTDIFYNMNLSDCTSLLHPLPIKLTARRVTQRNKREKTSTFTHSSRFQSIHYYILVLSVLNGLQFWYLNLLKSVYLVASIVKQENTCNSFLLWYNIYIFLSSSKMSFFFSLLKQDAYTINGQNLAGVRCVGERRGAGLRGRRRDWRILACHFLIWFVHGLELLQEAGGSKDVGRSWRTHEWNTNTHTTHTER